MDCLIPTVQSGSIVYCVLCSDTYSTVRQYNGLSDTYSTVRQYNGLSDTYSTVRQYNVSCAVL